MVNLANTTELEKSDLLARAITELAAARDQRRVMELSLETVCEIIGARGAGFVVLRNETCFYEATTPAVVTLRGKRFSLSQCPAGHALSEKKFIECTQENSATVAREIMEHAFIKSVVAFPVDAAFAIEIYLSEHRALTSSEILCLRSLADVCRLVLDKISRDLQLENLQKQANELIETNRDLETFAHSISHELRAPLRAINGFTQILVDDHGNCIDHGAMPYIRKVQSNAGQMSQLIDGLFSFFRTGKKQVRKTQIDNQQMVRQIIEELRQAGNANRVGFDIAELPACYADDVLIRQVWQNLLANAVKYTSQKPQPQVQVGYLKKNDEDVFFVSDNGAGFAMEDSKRLFGVFQRLHSQREFTGSGVGLAIVNRIVQRHGGRCWGEGEVGQGATFYFTLPSK
jgi:signal transduction histidine kinase